MNTDNPAARLLKIFERAREFNPDTKSKHVWPDLLGVTEPHLLMARYAKIIALPAEIVELSKELDLHDESTEHYWLSQVNNAFSNNAFVGPWRDFLGAVDDNSLNYLRMHSKLFALGSKVSQISPDELATWRKAINDLCEEVLASDADDSVKKYLAKRLRDIINALDEYNITGAEPILEAIEITYGHMVTDETYREFFRQRSSLSTKIENALTSVANMVTIVQGFAPAALPAFVAMTKSISE